jgi:spermidine/putrescine transport system permease protein
MLLLFHVLGFSPSLETVTIGHVVIVLPYTILVILPRLEQIDSSLAEAAYDLGAGPVSTFRWITLPLILPAILSAFLIGFTTSFDEFALTSFLIGTQQTFPIFLYSALRFPTQLPQVIAVAVLVICVTLVVIIGAEILRRRAEARLEAA